MNPSDDSLHPIAILIDELKHEDVQIRLNSVSRIHVIAKALGPERTRDELLPFLAESLDDEDEVLLVMAEELGKFVEEIGGSSQAFLLLNPLESLAVVDEAAVREMAIRSICAIIEQMPEKDIEEHYIALIRRLVARDWFTSRIAACNLIAIGYSKVQDMLKSELRRIFIDLCQDEMPMVRKSASGAMKSLIQVMDSTTIMNEFVPVFISLAQDKQDSVRLHVIESAIALADTVSTDVLTSEIIPIINTTARDSSWRVRWSIANKLCHFMEIMSSKGANITLYDCYVSFLRDSEAEVRTVAASKCVAICSVLPSSVIIEKIVPCLQSLSTDASDHVRSALGAVLMKIAPYLGRDATVEHILPLFFLLLNDSHSEVRLNVISNLDQGNQVVGIELLSQSLLPAIIHLAQDRQWRVRLAIIECIPVLATKLGQEFFQDNLTGLCMSWLVDNVYTIRDAATITLRRLTETFGIDWAITHAFPRVIEMQTSVNYLHRLTSLMALKALCDIFTSELIEHSILGIVLGLAKDPIPNVRFNVAKMLEFLSKKLDPNASQSKLYPPLHQLMQDSDNDVQYFASRALQALPVSS